MADYFTHLSCLLDVDTPENAARALDLYESFAADIEREESRDVGFLLSIAPQESDCVLWIHDDTTGEPEHVIRFVLICAETFNLNGLWGFEYAETCSRPRINAYGGGAHVIDLATRESVDWTNTREWLSVALDGGDPDA